MSISARRHPYAKRRDLIHCEVAPAKATASGARLAYVIQPLCLWCVLVDGEVCDGGGQLEKYIAPGAILLGAEILGATADVANSILYRSIREKTRQDVFNGLEIVRRDILIEQEEKDTVNLKGAIFVGA